MKLKGFILSLMTCIGLSSCATVVNGSTQKIPITTQPHGVAIAINGQHLGQTPTTVTLKRKQDHRIKLSKPGYQTQEVHLKRSMSGWVAGNILLPGTLVGIGIDAASGGMYKLGPEKVNVSMKPDEGYGYSE